jgi:hypothetical protein
LTLFSFVAVETGGRAGRQLLDYSHIEEVAPKQDTHVNIYFGMRQANRTNAEAIDEIYL